MGTVVQQTARPSSGQWTQLQRTLAPFSPPSWIFLAWCSNKVTSIVKDPTHPSHSLFQLLPSGREPALPDYSTAFFPRLWEPWTQTLNPAPLWNPIQTPNLLKHGPPPNTPTLPYHRTFFVQFEVCYTQVSGPVQTTCSNTLSSIRTRHFSHITVCT